MMKSAGVFAISMAAASATAANAFSSATKSPYQMDGGASKQIHRDYSSEKFTPTFDGLRFIETLVTAHR